MVNAPNGVASSTGTSANKSQQQVKNRSTGDQYSSLWQDDYSKDTEEEKKKRLSNYTQVVNAYYDGGTVIYTLVWGENFHFCRFTRGEAFRQAIARHEHYLAAQVRMEKGMRVLDVGCGIGGPAREMARFSGANIVGINNNEYQLIQAREWTRKAGFPEGQIEFVKADFMKLVEQFGENSFDAVYAIEATCHAPSFEGIYGQILKVLKPGGYFGCYEWCMTDRYDRNNPLHREIAFNIEVGDGIPEMRTIENATNAMKSVGFELLVAEDLAENDDEHPWYYPLEGDLRKAQGLFDFLICFWTTRIGKAVSQNSLWFAEKVLHLVPKGTWEVGEKLKKAQEGLVPGGQTKVFTPMMLFVGRKPQ